MFRIALLCALAIATPAFAGTPTPTISDPFPEDHSRAQREVPADRSFFLAPTNPDQRPSLEITTGYVGTNLSDESGNAVSHHQWLWPGATFRVPLTNDLTSMLAVSYQQEKSGVLTQKTVTIVGGFKWYFGSPMR